MTKRFIVIIVILAAIFGGTFAWYLVRTIMTKHFFANFQVPPVAVSTTVAKEITWHPILHSVGTLQAVKGVEVNSEVNGQVVKIYFKSGQFVKKGQPLVQLDDAVDQQTLNNNLAQLQLDTVNYQRQVRLYKMNATSKSSLDTAEAKMLQSRAQVASARVNIEKKHIGAPFAGKLGIRQVNLGEYISAGKAMVLLQSLDPLFVNFDLPEQHFKQIYVGQAVQITTDAEPGKVYKGTVNAINSSIEVSTRSISIQAKFPNKQHDLYPGLFADVSVILPEKIGVITIPQTSINYSLYGDSVYIIVKGKDKKGHPTLIAKQQFVKLGESRGTVVEVLKGIKAGDTVVTSGQLKLHSGARVVINNSIKLK